MYGASIDRNSPRRLVAIAIGLAAGGSAPLAMPHWAAFCPADHGAVNFCHGQCRAWDPGHRAFALWPF
jgi:hypothetical protein